MSDFQEISRYRLIFGKWYKNRLFLIFDASKTFDMLEALAKTPSTDYINMHLYCLFQANWGFHHAVEPTDVSVVRDTDFEMLIILNVVNQIHLAEPLKSEENSYLKNKKHALYNKELIK